MFPVWSLEQNGLSLSDKDCAETHEQKSNTQIWSRWTAAKALISKPWRRANCATYLQNEQVVASSNIVVSRADPRIVTGMMLGVFLAFGVDTIILVGVLWYIGRISGVIAGVVSAAVLVVFVLWMVTRWIRFRWTDRLDSEGAENAESRAQRTPLEKLKHRYAEGEISDGEFEKQLDALLDADDQAESSADQSTLVHDDRERD